MFSNTLPFAGKRQEATRQKQVHHFLQLSCVQKQNRNPSEADARAAMHNKFPRLKLK